MVYRWFGYFRWLLHQNHYHHVISFYPPITLTKTAIYIYNIDLFTKITFRTSPGSWFRPPEKKVRHWESSSHLISMADKQDAVATTSQKVSEIL